MNIELKYNNNVEPVNNINCKMSIHHLMYNR